MKEKYNITGMSCSACSSHVEKVVSELDGVSAVSVSLLQNSMTVEYDKTKISSETIAQAVKDGGYEALPVRREKFEPSHKDGESNAELSEINSVRSRLRTSLLFLAPLMYISMGSMIGLPIPELLNGAENSLVYALTQFILTIPVLFANRKFFIVGFRSLIKGAPNMDTLIATGASAAVIYSTGVMYLMTFLIGHGLITEAHHHSMDLYFESAATILTLITVGKYLEARSKGRTTDAIARLLKLAPDTATVLRDGAETEIPSGDVILGDIVVMRSGCSIPVDGVILEGNCTVDESTLTGESIPVDKIPGSPVTAGTINRSGYFTFRATKVGDDTTLARIVELVREAAGGKAPVSRLADRVSGVFVPVVICISIAAAALWLISGSSLAFAVSIGISVLVISCPCALGLATPTAIMVGTGRAAELGILFKSAESLETAHTINTVVLDKTGTITEGKPEVTDIITSAEVSERELLLLAASLEHMSEHPLAEAIVRRSELSEISLTEARDLKSYPGRGVSGSVGGRIILAGNRSMMEERGLLTDEYIKREEHLAEEGKTPLYIADENVIIGLIALADVVKPTSAGAVANFKGMGIEVVMLTGDNRRTSEAIRKKVGIDRVLSELMPEDKEKEVAAIQSEGRRTAMVGDGINDAPALVRADVGIAIGAGTDIAIDSADIVLMKSDLQDAVTAINLSRAVIRNIKQNLFWAFFYNAVGIPLAAGALYPIFGWKLSPMFAAAAMSLSSFCVVSNALRLRFFKPETENRALLDNIKAEEVKRLTKIMVIEGMSCGHCSARVEKVLNAIEGVEAKVDLKAKTATVTLSSDITDEALKTAVENAGYEVISVKNTD